MKSQIIQIGNSQGIRIPKVLLEESRLSGDVELELHPDGVLIKKAQKPRGDWDDRFAALADLDDEEMTGTRVTTSFDKKEWQW